MMKRNRPVPVVHAQVEHATAIPSLPSGEVEEVQVPPGNLVHRNQLRRSHYPFLRTTCRSSFLDSLSLVPAWFPRFISAMTFGRGEFCS